MDWSPKSSSSSTSSSSEDRAAQLLQRRCNEDDDWLNLVLACIDQEDAGSYRRGKKQTQHNFDDAKYCIDRDYLGENPIFTDEQFRKRFRVSKQRYLEIRERLSASNRFFQEIPDGVTKRCISKDAKLLIALRQMATGVTGEQFLDYFQMGRTRAEDCLFEFCATLVNEYSDVYLRKPTLQDLKRLSSRHSEKHNFPGMLGSIDCCHWQWKNCPKAFEGQYQGKEGVPTVVLEAIADYDLWIWHAFFGIPGSCNDINVLEASPILGSLLKGGWPQTKYFLDGKEFNQMYVLADGIYPEWSVFVKTISNPANEVQSRFSAAQEAARKDVERAFGVLQNMFQIFQRPCQKFYVEAMHVIVLACIILHNMAVEERLECGREVDADGFFETSPDSNVGGVTLNHGAGDGFSAYAAQVEAATHAAQVEAATSAFTSRTRFYELRRNLMTHLDRSTS